MILPVRFTRLYRANTIRIIPHLAKIATLASSNQQKSCAYPFKFLAYYTYVEAILT